MFKYAFYVCSIITVCVVCFHKAICEDDKKYWLRDQQFWPSIQKYRNLIKKSKGLAEGYAENNVDPMLQNHNKHDSLKLNGRKSAMDMQVNIRPMFRVNFNAEEEESAHGGHARKGNVVERVLGHSRESYIRSQAIQRLKSPLKIEEKEDENDLKSTKYRTSQLQTENENQEEPDEIKTKKKEKSTAKTEPTTAISTKKNKGDLVVEVSKDDEAYFRGREKMSTKRYKKGRDFDRYKEERDLDKKEQELIDREKDIKKEDSTREEYNFNRFKEKRNRQEREYMKKEKDDRNKYKRSSEERDFQPYRESLRDKKNILRGGRGKRGKKVYVTKGLIEREEPTTYRNDDNSYESVDYISSEQQQTESHTTKFTIRPRYPQLNMFNRYPLIRTGTVNDENVFEPSTLVQQLSPIKNKFKQEAIIDQEIIGRTYGGNDIVLWKIKEKKSTHRHARRSNAKKKYVDEPPEKKIVFIAHGLSVMGWHELDCLSKPKRLETLLDYYLENLDSFDIYLMPMANPDGVATLMADKWWNKNHSPQPTCPGVNLDRNFDVQWNASHGKLMSSCHQRYPGQTPFSEHETRAVREVFHRYGYKIVAYFHVHAGTYDASVFKGDAILYPRGYMMQQSEDDKYVDLRADIDEAMRNSSFKTLSVTADTLYNWYGEVRGTSVDYASSVIGIPYALELVMQVYKDNPQVTNPENREKNAALVEIWQVLIDVIFDSIYGNAIKPNEP